MDRRLLIARAALFAMSDVRRMTTHRSSRARHDAQMSGAPNASIVVRAAGDADIADILAIWAANGDTIPEGGANLLTPYLVHLMSTGRVLVAADDDGAVGFGAVIERAGVTHLADLFVLPDRFGQGIGALLLDRLFADTGARTTFASSDPRALPLYVRSGMTPYWPNLYLDGDSAALPPDAPGLVCEPAGLDTTIELEQRWLGASSPDDHHFWAALPEARPFVVVEAGRPVAAVHARLRRSWRRSVDQPARDVSGRRSCCGARCRLSTRRRGRPDRQLPTGPEPGSAAVAGVRLADHRPGHVHGLESRAVRRHAPHQRRWNPLTADDQVPGQRAMSATASPGPGHSPGCSVANGPHGLS